MPLNQADYLPLAEGQEWYMDAVMETPSGEAKRGTAHRIVEKSVVRDGRTWFLSRTTIEFPPKAKQVYTKLLRKDEHGFYSLMEDDPLAVEQTEIPFPLTEGHEWTRKEGTREMRDRVVGVETIKLGDVEFRDCCHIQSVSVGEKRQSDYWEAPKVGNIKNVILLPDGSRVTVTLHEYKPGPP